MQMIWDTLQLYNHRIFTEIYPDILTLLVFIFCYKQCLYIKTSILVIFWSKEN